MQYNWEVQILSAMQKHVGFPAAPEVGGATDDEMTEDFEALGVCLFHTAADLRWHRPDIMV